MSNINDGSATSGRSSIAGETADKIRDRAGDAADALKGAGAKASASAQDMGDKATGLLDKAKGMASDAGDKVSDALEDRKAAGSERIKGISGAIRRAADELEHELPPAATYIRRAADEIDAVADAVQRRDVRQLLGDVQSFARRQPAAFLGATVLGGFAVMRLLKAPTAGKGTSDDPAPSAAGGTALVPAGAPSALDDTTVMEGSGDPGGIAPAAPGFAPTAPSAGKRAGRS